MREFIGSSNSRGVEYLIVGAHSLAFHARPRFTGDLDILVRPTRENAEKLVTTLNEFGFADLGLSVADFAERINHSIKVAHLLGLAFSLPSTV